MRVNLDSAALHDPRFRRMSKVLGITVYEVLGRAVHVWMVCYERREAILEPDDIDVAADLDGFATAMCSVGLAEGAEGGIYVCGVIDRIEFLERQSEKGKKSGEVRRSKNQNRTGTGTHARTDVQRGFGGGSNKNGTSVEHRFGDGSTNHRTYSPDLDQALTLAPDQDLKDHRVPAAQGETQNGTIDAFDSDESGTDPRPKPAGSEKRSPSRAHASVEPVKQRVPEAPLPALTTASLLMDYLLRNHPGSKLARATEVQRENTLAKWAHEVRLMSEMDRLEYGAIQAMVHWSQRDAFWKTVILNAQSLRDKWDKMHAQKSRPRARASATHEQEPTPDEIKARRARNDLESRRSLEHVAEMQRAAEEQRPDVVAELAKAKAALGIVLPHQALDNEPEPEEDPRDV